MGEFRWVGRIGGLREGDCAKELSDLGKLLRMVKGGADRLVLGIRAGAAMFADTLLAG